MAGHGAARHGKAGSARQARYLMKRPKFTTTSNNHVPCGACPLWSEHRQWDGSAVLLQKTNLDREGREVQSVDERGNPIFRRDLNGDPIRIGWCVAKLPVVIKAEPGNTGPWPTTMSHWWCESPEKHAALSKAGMSGQGTKVNT
jgi:hypothetical protein